MANYIYSGITSTGSLYGSTNGTLNGPGSGQDDTYTITNSTYYGFYNNNTAWGSDNDTYTITNSTFTDSVVLTNTTVDADTTLLFTDSTTKIVLSYDGVDEWDFVNSTVTTIRPGGGNDTINVTDSTITTVNLESGDDIANVYGASTVIQSLEGKLGSDTITVNDGHVENIFGDFATSTAGAADTITVNGGSFGLLHAGSGNDTVLVMAARAILSMVSALTEGLVVTQLLLVPISTTRLPLMVTKMLMA